MSTTYLIVCPSCNDSELKLVVKRNGEDCEICKCGFPENTKIYEWSI
jgi:hypothetical protein